MDKKKILGIDPSIRSTGVCLKDGDNYIYKIIGSGMTKKVQYYKHKCLEIIQVSHEDMKDKTSIEKEMAITNNIYSIVEQVRFILIEHKPDYVVIESCAFNASGRVADLSGLNHCIRYACMQRNIPIFAVSPTTNKLEFVGSGQATKEMMINGWSGADPNAADIIANVGKHAADLADAFSLVHFPISKLPLNI